MEDLIKWIKEKLVTTTIEGYKEEEDRTLYITRPCCGIRASIDEKDEDNPYMTFRTVLSEKEE